MNEPDLLTQIRYVCSAAILLAGISMPLAAMADSDSAKKVSPAPPVLTGGYSMDYNSRYIWRGIAYSRKSVAQPSVWISHSNLTLSFWGNGALASTDGGAWNEFDWTVSDATSWGHTSIEADYEVYTYPYQHDSPSTGEATLKLSLPVGSLRVFTTQNFDVMRYPGSYYGEAGISGERRLTAGWNGDAAVTVGFGSARFNEVYLGRHQAALNMVGLDLGLAHSVGVFAIRPHITTTSLLDHTLRQQESQPDLVSFGLSIERDW